MNDVRTFRAPTMQDALALVRQELGGDAVILHTRQVTRKRRLPWRKPVEEVEITAGLGVNVRPIVTRNVVRPPANAAATAVRERSATERAPVAAPSPRAAADRFPQPASAVGSNRISSMRSAAASRSQTTGALENDDDEYLVNPRPVTAQRAPALASAIRAATIPSSTERALDGFDHERTRHRETAADAKSAERFSERLDAIEKMLHQLGGSVRNQIGADVPPELVRVYSNLIDEDVSDTDARDLVLKLRGKLSASDLEDAELIERRLMELLQAGMPCGGMIRTEPERRMVVALVGATGVGKTTTLAKLAATYKLRDGLKVGLVTVDTYRIAAVEQLRTYAEIIDLPMKVVTTPEQMRLAMDELAGLDLVLIDTAGRSPRDDVQLRELKEMLDAAQVDQIQLVLSVASGRKNLEQTIRKFQSVQPTAVIVTKLDEAAGLGGLWTIARGIQRPISYVTTGQNVPNDIEPARPGRLADWVLGYEPEPLDDAD